jgi:hypothetical protein
MKVVKNFAARDDNVDRLSEIFDGLVTKMHVIQNLDTLEFHVRDRNIAKLHEMNAIISVDYDDPFVREGDEKGMRALLLHSIYHIIIRKRYDVSMPHFIEDILINRQMILDGYADDVFYVAYIYLLGKKHANFVDFLAISIPWLSFYGLDNYSSEFLQEMMKMIKYDRSYDKRVTRLFDSLKKDLTNETNIMHSIHLYEVMLCR